MPTHRLRRNMHLRIKGQEYVIEKRLPNCEIQIKNIVTNECSSKPEAELVKILLNGDDAELLGVNRNQVWLDEHLKKSHVSDIALLEEDDPRRIEMHRREAYVLEVLRQSVSKMTEETLRPIIDKIGAKRSEIEFAQYKKLSSKDKAKVKAKPSTSTIIRWINSYIKSGDDVRALVPVTKARGNRDRKFSGPLNKKTDMNGLKDADYAQMKVEAKRRAERVAELIDEAIDEVFLNEQRFSVQDVYDAVVVKVADENQHRDASNQLPQPDRSSVYDVVNKLDDYDILKARYGQEIADEKYRAYKQGPRPTRPLERVEGDHTKADMFVIDPVMMLPIGRPTLTWLMCVFTKMILGFYISFNPCNSLAIMECLKHAIRPKTYVRDKYPSIRNDWPTYGVMERLVLDNAPEFWGKHLEDACRQLGINIQFGQKGRAWYRGSIERSLRTANTRLLHRQPGTTFSNIMDRADYEPGKNALITPDLLDEVMHKYIIDVQQFSPHRGIKDIPALRWEKGVQQWPPALPAKASDLDVVLGYIERRCINRYGIEIDTIIYNDDDLALLRSQPRKSDKDRRFIIKRLPDDLSLIYVYDEKHDRYLPVPAVDQDYTKGLSIWQHSVIRKYARERLKADVDIVSLCRAKMEIQEIVERDWQKIRTSRVKMARFKNEGIQDRREIIKPEGNDTWVEQTLGSPGAREKLLPMNPEAVESFRTGVSDLGSSFDASKFERDESEPPALGSIEEGLTKKTNNRGGKKKTSNGAKHKDARDPASKQAAEKTEDQADSPDEIGIPQEIAADEELDMSGWTAGYDMPA